MKYLKIYERFILEKYNQLTKFYHVTDKENLESLLNGIDITMSVGRGQGNGFYVITDQHAAENSVITSGQYVPTYKKCDLLIEIEAVLNVENFDIDYELVKDLPTAIKNIEPKLASRFKTFKISSDSRVFNIIVNLSDDVDQNDFTVQLEELEGMGVFIPKCHKEIEFGFYPEDVDKYQNDKNVAYTTLYIDSLDRLGVKSIIEEEIFNRIGNNDIAYALRYVGPKIKPSRYKFKENGKWGDWII